MYRTHSSLEEIKLVGIKVRTCNHDELEINTANFSYKGEHDLITDAFRDFARRYGIRIYAPRGFKFNLTRK